MPIVLLYHDVTSPGGDDLSGFPGGGAARYKLTDAEFRDHLQAVSARAPGPPSKLLDPTASGDWSLTFDDGGVSAHAPIADLLDGLGWKGYFFVTTNHIDSPTFLNREQIRDLDRRGHEIGSHSCSHPTRMSSCTPERLLEEWRRSRETLSDILGRPVDSASVPGGFYSEAVGRAASEAGLKVLFTSEPRVQTDQLGDCLIVGRYTIYRGMSADQAAQLTSHRHWARTRQSVHWQAKKAAKRVGGKGYLWLRERLLRTRDRSDVHSSP